MKITRLPEDLANQIAAGEVVERPSSVVKELVENAIDAGATRIAVHVELGGKRLVRVEDNGEGMAPEDARLAIERHATSKIRRAEDLGAIATLGFRGEALPSIASVSRFVLRTRPGGRPAGVEIRVNGGTVAAVQETAAAQGTVVEVGDLFYNLPARRKFLKSDAAEAAQVSRITTQLALAYPGIGFTLTSGPRAVLQVPPARTLADRLYQLYGDRQDLVEIARSAGGVRLTGYVAALAEQGTTRGAQNVFVNRRIVKDRTIAHAIIEAYSAASIKERSPEVHLFLEVPADEVDVNVHPTKAEVRFRHQSLVHEVVRRALADGLGRGPAPELRLASPPSAQEPVATSLPGVLAGGQFPSRWTLPAAPGHASGDAARVPRAIRPMMALGQFRDTFIIAVDDEGVAIVDQHVAHERVLYERAIERLSAGTLESQRLLVPLLLDLPPAGRDALLARAAEAARLGFEYDVFGDGTIRLTAVPSVLSLDASERALRGLADDLEGLGGGAGVQDALRRMAATMACHAAVKANDPLTPEKMAHILAELKATAHSTVCPHGRPVMLRLTRREIEKNFERI